MLDYLKKAANRTQTENGAATYRTTGSDCLDLFASIGALRGQSRNEVEQRFLFAFAEDPNLAMKILFYARDVRGGLGERAVFRTLLRWLAVHEKAALVRNLDLVAEYGRWDDLLVLLHTPAQAETVALLRRQFEADCAALAGDGEVSLLGKWLPSVNASKAQTVQQAKLLSRAFGLREAEYRKAVSALRARLRILENHLRERDYSFDYAQQPAQAMLRYRKAFLRNDGARYRGYLSQVNSGAARLHTGTLMPYEIVAAAWRAADEGERAALDATWRALEDFTDGENALVVADGSGSMYGGSPSPAAVAQSLAIYFAEHTKGKFHNHFITFSTHPQLVEIKGRDITEKVRYCQGFNEVADTNLQAVFELILRTAVAHRLPQKELPSTLYIISDMEFNWCTRDASLTNFQYAQRLFRYRGYRLPRVVFWNVRSHQRQQPVTANAQGVALVSGCTPRIFAQVMSGEMDPYKNMLRTVCTPRYERVRAV